MQKSPEHACLVIADITGYTGYLAGVELDHAQDILADLIGTVIGSLKPTFRLAKLEGDAAFAYLPTDRIDGSALQDTIEATYFAFHRRLRDIKQSSRCECNACMLIPNLDLKFVVHHGMIARQRFGALEELVGSDVILVHRLLKNAVEERTGVRAYAMYTDACVTAAAIDPPAQGLVEHTETIDVIGEVRTWVRDLERAWADEQDRQRYEVTPEAAYRTYAFEVDVPPQVAWDFVTSPVRRPQWGVDMTEVIELEPSRRRGAGSVNHCMHGKDAVLEEVLDWRPYEYWTTRSKLPYPGVPLVLNTDAFIPLPGGRTRVETRLGIAKPRDRSLWDRRYPEFEPMIEGAVHALKAALDAEAARLASEDRSAEPEPPAAEASYLTSPVRAKDAVDSGAPRASSR